MSRKPTFFERAQAEIALKLFGKGDNRDMTCMQRKICRQVVLDYKLQKISSRLHLNEFNRILHSYGLRSAS